MSWDGFLNEIFKVVELLQLLGKAMFSFDIRKQENSNTYESARKDYNLFSLLKSPQTLGGNLCPFKVAGPVSSFPNSQDEADNHHLGLNEDSIHLNI